MSDGLRVAGEEISKVFNRRTIFSRVSFSVAASETLLISGRNGSGKSTLVKILSHVLTPTSGKVTVEGPGDSGELAAVNVIGLVSPYLQMFEEFSARENLELAMRIRGLDFDAPATDALLDRVALYPRRNDPVRTFSSGMKQRVKYAFALLHSPPVLILDEPMANLDADGVEIVRRIMNEQRERGILIIATNDLDDVEHIDRRVDLNARP